MDTATAKGSTTLGNNNICKGSSSRSSFHVSSYMALVALVAFRISALLWFFGNHPRSTGQGDQRELNVQAPMWWRAEETLSLVVSSTETAASTKSHHENNSVSRIDLVDFDVAGVNNVRTAMRSMKSKSSDPPRSANATKTVFPPKTIPHNLSSAVIEAAAIKSAPHQRVSRNHTNITKQQHLQQFSFHPQDFRFNLSLSDWKQKNLEWNDKAVGAAAAAAAAAAVFSKRYEMCFVTSIFAASLDHADQPASVLPLQRLVRIRRSHHRALEQQHAQQSSSPRVVDASSSADTMQFRFLLYTNLPDLRAPGWLKLVQTDLIPGKYQRMITASRQAKFLAWRDTEHVTSQCAIVFYVDGFYGIRATDTALQGLRDAARQIWYSRTGFGQYLHPRYVPAAANNPNNSTIAYEDKFLMRGSSLQEEWDRIVASRKDVPEHVAASQAWLQAQPDYVDRCVLYQNTFLAYIPESVPWQKATSFFWNRYSQELDSWRDQPLWCYTMHHFGFHPVILEPGLRHSSKSAMWHFRSGKMGHGGHHYQLEQSSRSEPSYQ